MTGLTSNPTIFDQAFKGSADYDADIRAAPDAGLAGEALFFDLALDDLTRAADLFAPVHERTAGSTAGCRWRSRRCSPTTRTARMAAAKRAARARRRGPTSSSRSRAPPKACPPSRRHLRGRADQRHAALSRATHYLAAAEAYLRGIERRLAAGLSLDVRSVASLFVSRWDEAVARARCPTRFAASSASPSASRPTGPTRELLDSPRWERLANAGARPQRLLLGQHRHQGPKTLATSLYVEALAAPHTVNTMPEETLLAFADHGRGGSDAHATAATARPSWPRFAVAGVDHDALAARLQHEGAAAFVASWNDLLAGIAGKTAELSA